MPVVNVEEPLRQKLGENGVNSLMNLINESQEGQKAEILTFVEEKFERRLSEEILGLKNGLREEMRERDKALLGKISALEVSLTKDNAKLKVEMMNEIAKLRTDMTTENAKTRTEIMKWMFIFWVGQLGAMLGILFTLLK